MKKRIVSFLMALVMAVSLLPVSAFAVEDTASPDVPAIQATETSDYGFIIATEKDESKAIELETLDSSLVSSTQRGNSNYKIVIPSSTTTIYIKFTSNKFVDATAYVADYNNSPTIRCVSQAYKDNLAGKYTTPPGSIIAAQYTVSKNYQDGWYAMPLEGLSINNSSYPGLTFSPHHSYYSAFVYQLANNPKVPSVNKAVGILIQAGEDGAGLTDEQKKPLADLLATVADGNTNYYQSNDRWNGKTASKTGFWAEFTAANGPRTTAQKTLETATEEEHITTAVADLAAAIDNLIPTSQLNPTELYEGLESFKGYTDEFLEKTFTENSAVRFKAKLAEAEEYLNSLFDGNGDPTAENVPENQSKADGYLKAVSAALVNKEDLAKAQDNVKIVNALLKQCPTANNGVYTEDSWNAFVAARDAAKEYFAKYPVTEEGYVSAPSPQQHSKLAKQLVNAIQSLTPAAEQITVTLIYTDDYHLRVPDNKITDPACNKPGTRTVTLAGGATIADLLEKTGYD